MNYQSMTRRFGCALILLPAFAFGSAFAVFGELGTRSAHAISVVADENKLKAELEFLREELVRMRAENAELKKKLDAKVGKAAKQAAAAMVKTLYQKLKTGFTPEDLDSQTLIRLGDHLRLKISVSEDALEVPTVSDIWPTADWHEREAYDMLGITFPGHPDLRRILMWDGYPYFPLRKDFPLEGKPSEVPDVAFTRAAPLEGGPFVSVPSDGITKEREPRARHV